MKIIRYTTPEGAIFHGSTDDGKTARRIEGDLWGDFRVSEKVDLVGKLLAPVQPAAILCIGLNYRAHAQETGAREPVHPVLFMKSPSAVQHPGAPIELPRHLPSTKVDYECELAVVIGRACKNAMRENALDHVLGYTCGNDVSARDWQKDFGGGQWCRGKGFDTFCPLGPWIVTADEIPDPNTLPIRTVMNGEVMQESNTSDMIFDVPRLIEFLSGSTTLLPGTVIMTGTPSGVGMARTPPVWLADGDTVTIQIDGIGELSNPVRTEP